MFGDIRYAEVPMAGIPYEGDQAPTWVVQCPEIADWDSKATQGTNWDNKPAAVSEWSDADKARAYVRRCSNATRNN